MLEVDAVRVEEQLSAVTGHLNAAHVALVEVAGDAVATGAWAVAGIRTPCQWLCWQAGIAAGTARKVLAVAAARATHPVISGVFAEGRLSLDQAAVAVTAPAHVDAQIAELAVVSTVAQLHVAVRVATPAPEPDAPDAPGESVAKWFDDDGRWHLAAELDSDRGRLVDAALGEARDRLFRHGHLDVTWADALVDLAERSLDQAPLTRRERFRVNLFLDPGADIAASWGPPVLSVANDRSQPVATDSWVDPNGIASDAVNCPSQQAWNSRLRRTERVMPWCGARHGLEIHHLVHREDGGPTATWNLVTLCRHCHRQHHVGKFGIAGDADQPDGLSFTDQHGRPIDPAARPRPPSGPPLEPVQPYQHPLGERADWRWLHFPDPPPRAA